MLLVARHIGLVPNRVVRLRPRRYLYPQYSRLSKNLVATIIVATGGQGSGEAFGRFGGEAAKPLTIEPSYELPV